ncbi:inositol oxygenase [Thraustotheca clavata]|uniref:Inositol oxygenase n=1 Tax=Thraustotheca clavata TaxID=74557 RepID=A0A1W0A487_9STRA|nr:inositol oxygenase [Thraustotheca clavata]
MNINVSMRTVAVVETGSLMNMGKFVDEFRNYKDSDRQAIVERHYRLMRANQTVEFHEKMQKYWGTFNRAQLSRYVDSSDPDSSLPNLEHMLQTAEAIRAAGHPDWFQLVGLLHDMGKIQYLWGKACDGQQGTADGDQWALGGDTWVVGCAIPDTAVFPQFNALNPDMQDERYNIPNGMYQEHCGLANLKFAWGHDEYMYQMLVFNKATIPEEGLAMIRYHSCYPWHNKGEYHQFMTDDDWELLDWVLEFNKFDLYTKADKRPDVAALWPYYQSLIDKYMPGKLWW